MRNDIITRIETTLTPDGQGGWTEETIETGSFDVKLSIGSNVEEATAYGVSIEQILKVVADVPLMENEASLYIVKGETGPIGPQGLQGEAGKDGTTYTPSIGEVTTVDSNELASASVSVNTETKEAVFNFAIPRGNKGIDGVQISDNETVENKTWSSSKITSEIPTTLPANGGNADTVNNHTVKSDVPENAVFTDTTYSDATQIEHGLMSVDDKTKLDGVEEGATKTLIDIKLSSTSTNPVQNKVVTNALNNKADKSKYSDKTINVGRKAGTTVGAYSTAEGSGTTASEYASHAEGSGTTASGFFSHAEGYSAAASGSSSHAEGYHAVASGDFSHAEGYYATASSYSSHAEGYWTTADNYASHVSGKYNVVMTTGGDSGNTTGTAFVIGNGTGSSALSNAFSVQFDGTVKAKSTITASTTADYAEFFEWLDKNPNEEDRVGHFVTLDGNKIKIATSEDDYILGIVSGEPFVLGNGDCDTWNGMYLHDEFRRTIYEPAPKMIEILDNEGNPTGEYEEVKGEFEGTRPKLNPEYDPTKQYISRFDRAEWSPVGMLGMLAVLHDGTAEVNGYVTVNNEGIATKCTRDTRNSYRVIKKVSDKVVEVIFR